jgi:uncharacterized iron-regulated membrane protein
MTRQFWVIIHRYAGLAMALFLIMAGLTGSILAFNDELDAWLNPGGSPTRIPVAVQASPLLNPLELHDRAAALIPEARSASINLQPKPGEAYIIELKPRIDPQTGHPYPIEYDTLQLDPYTGAEIGRTESEIPDDEESYFPLTRANVLKFIFVLHSQLAVGEMGGWVLGFVALVWSLDCFVGFYLTLPKNSSARETSVYRQRYWSRWQPAWAVKWSASALRLNFDLHRAGGLWTWPLLFVFAWSGVMFNLPQVYDPVMAALFSTPPETATTEAAARATHREPDFRAAYQTAQKLMAEQAQLHGFKVVHESGLFYFENEGAFMFSVSSDRDISEEWSQTQLLFDGESGKLLRLDPLPSGEYSGLTVRYWLWSLHMAKVWGLPYKIVVALMGLVVAMLSITGIYIWLKKRKSRQFSKTRNQAVSK